MASECSPDLPAPFSYRLLVWLRRPVTLQIGALGRHRLRSGLYSYTGSARRNPLARLRRHLSRENKRLRWHIDYLLACADAEVVDVDVYHEAECALNRRQGGMMPVPGMGASDCLAGCGSHFRYLGDRPWSGNQGMEAL
ncbi:MAG: GIY-YIG nuclease family protein [Ectothiorhodospiraceae bacterium]|nr:GIY-YIG nuclease family protein [Ectothiorhodospiraceae bacterium]